MHANSAHDMPILNCNGYYSLKSRLNETETVSIEYISLEESSLKQSWKGESRKKFSKQLRRS
jgi:hypothetical protein